MHERTHGHPQRSEKDPNPDFGLGGRLPEPRSRCQFATVAARKPGGFGIVYDYTRKLKFDRRLLRRRGWVDPEELEKERSDLPDVFHKTQSLVEGEEPSPEPEEPPSQEVNQPD